MASSPEKMAGLELTAANARALVQAGRLRELIGVAPDASPEEVKAACKRALLIHHPDKGGDPEVFKIVQPALQQEEHFYAFEGGAPSWATEQLAQIAGYRREVDEAIQELHAAKAKAESATDSGRAKAKADAERSAERRERWIENANAALNYALSHFKACYAQHIDNEQQRKEGGTREATAREKQRLEWARADNSLRQRRRRQTSACFPRMPRAVTDAGAWNALDKLRQEYRRVIKTTHKRTQRGSDNKDLEPRAAALMAQARALVDQCCRTVHAQAVTRRKRFPTLPSSDPRSQALAKFCQEHRKLKNRMKGVMPDDRRRDLQSQIEEIMSQAASLLEAAGHTDTAPEM
jgi:hypothetical protein